MELLLGAAVLGIGIIVNNKNESEKSKRQIDNTKINISNKKPSSNNIYDSNFSRRIDNSIRKAQNERYNIAISDSNIIPLNTDLHNKRKDLDKYNKQAEKYLDRPLHTRTSNERDSELIENFNSDSILSLSGERMDKNNFFHNNMVPFFGSQVKQNVDIYANQGILENFTGNRVNDITKEEIAPLFEPTKNLSNIYGTQNKNDIELDRYVPSKYQPFTHPVEQIKVGPGLNKGYSSKPSGGYQDLNNRDFELPKTTDELRVLTNPKLTYKGRIIPGKKIAKPGMIGKMEKKLPDTFYVNTPERYMTTVGAYTKPKTDPKILMKYTNRPETEKPYTGGSAPAVRVKPTTRGKYEKSKNNVLSSYGFRNADKTGEWSNNNKNNDYGKSGIELQSTEREVTQFRTHTSNIVSMVKSLVAPIEDVLKHTRKENAIGNIRQAGNVTMPVPNKLTVHDPDDITRTTIKETQIHNNRTGNFNGPKCLTTYDPDDVTRATIKETNIHNNREGNIHSGISQLPAYDPDDITRTTIKETNIHNNRNGYVNSGVTQLPAYDPDDITRTTIKETNIHNNRSGYVNSGISQLPAYDPDDITRTTIKETNIHNERSGYVNSGVGQLPAYDPDDITRTTIKETNIHNERSGYVHSGVGQLPAYDPDDITRTTIKETNIHNERSGYVHSSVGQLPAYDPDDITRTTIKETNIHNNRNGYVNSGVSQLPAYDPDDITRTTIKETNIHDNRTGNIRTYKHKGMKEKDPKDISKITIRNTLEETDYTMNFKKQGPSNQTIYDPNDIAKTTIKETNIHNIRDGNIQGIEGNDGYKIEANVFKAPETHKQFTSDIEYMGDPTQAQGDGYLVNDYRAPETNKQFTSDIDYTGIADGVNDKPMSYSDIYNATLNDIKQDIAKGREPTNNSVKIPLGEDSIYMTTNKIELENNVLEKTRITQIPPDLSQCNITTEKDTLDNKKIEDRLNPEMVEQFKKNPYTQSLNSFSFN